MLIYIISFLLLTVSNASLAFSHQIKLPRQVNNIREKTLKQAHRKSGAEKVSLVNISKRLLIGRDVTGKGHLRIVRELPIESPEQICGNPKRCRRADFVLPHPQEWISAFGFALTSDLIFLPTEPGSLAELNRGDVVYVYPRRLKEFYKNMHLIKEPIVLLTVNEDISIPSDLLKGKWFSESDSFSETEVADLLNHPMLLHWFAQNYEDTLDSEKISHIPIGLNFHFNFGSQGVLWGSSSVKQSDLLSTISQNSKPVKERARKIYYDAWLSSTERPSPTKTILNYYKNEPYLTRQEIKQRFEDEIFFDAVGPALREEQWLSKANEYAFTISPFGNGLDCFRTWESLAVGQIVIVHSGPLDKLYEGLPVVIVNNWDEVNSHNLDLWLEKFSDSTSNPRYRELLGFNYWHDKIHQYKK